MKKYGWKKDLSDKVRRGIKDQLVRDEVRTAHAHGESEPQLSDDEISGLAIERGADIQKLHRKDVAASQVVVNLLRGQLVQVATHRGDIEDDIYDETINYFCQQTFLITQATKIGRVFSNSLFQFRPHIDALLSIVDLTLSKGMGQTLFTSGVCSMCSFSRFWRKSTDRSTSDFR